MYKLITKSDSIPKNFTGCVEHTDSTKYWYVNGKLHREHGLPAVKRNNGDKFWYVNGLRHRDNGLPAFEYANGSKFWYVNDKLHRDNGLPAVEYTDGHKEWWVNGSHVTEEQAKKLDEAKKLTCKQEVKPICQDKLVTIEGIEYKLVPTSK